MPRGEIGNMDNRTWQQTEPMPRGEIGNMDNRTWQQN